MIIGKKTFTILYNNYNILVCWLELVTNLYSHLVNDILYIQIIANW